MTSSRTDLCIAPELLRATITDLLLSGPVSLARVAERLGVSPRTVQRHLSVHDMNFRMLVMDRRHEVAAILLCRTELSIGEVAARVGYSTPSAFTRAFVRWHGRPPRAFRAARATRGQPADLARNGQK